MTDAPARRFGAFGLVVIIAGVVLAAWVSLGRIPFGIAGELTPWFVVTLGLLIAVLHFFTGRAIVRTARLGRATRPVTILYVCFSWACGLLLGLMIPDVTADGWQTIISGPGEPMLSIAVGLANPLGIVCIATAVVALVLAGQDARGSIRRHDDEDFD